MANLPPKPVSSPPSPSGKDNDNRRRPVDDRSARHLSHEDRAYVPSHSRPLGDTYVASYDRSRDDDRYRDRDWDRRNRDSRDRGLRGRDDDRDRFGYRYDRRRDDSYIAYDDRRPRRPISPRRLDRYRSRSPRSRRPYSPPRHIPRSRHSRSPAPNRRPRHNESPRSLRSPRPRSPSRSRTPEQRKRDYAGGFPSDRSKAQGNLGSLNTATSPSKRKLSLSRSRSRTRPAHKVPEDRSFASPKVTEKRAFQETSAIQNRPSQQPAPDRATHSKDAPLGNKLEQKGPLASPKAAQRSPRQLQEPKEEPRSSPKLQANQETDVKMRDRSASPPRQPRHMGNQATRDGPYIRRSSRSPPRGPRNAPKISAPSPHPSGGRRPPPLALLPYSRASHGLHDTSNSMIEPHAKRNTKSERVSVTASLDAEIARLESHRANLAAEYVQLAKNARRALHELDMATLDLRAAEARRKVADSHLEKARVGMFGIDVVPTIG